MGGDYSKDGFDALRDFAGVFLQQGRPVLDSDWNEMVRVLERRIRAGTVDTFGRAVVPRETEAGFHIRHGTAGLEIGPGRLYLDGMLVENHGNADFGAEGAGPAPVFDRGSGAATDPLGVLDEMTSAPEGYVRYADQPWWPVPDSLPTSGGPYLAYLVAWQRELTPVKQPLLLDPALGGVDSATRWQTVWQVRLLGGIGTDATCATPEDDLAGWPETIAPSTARLTTRTVAVDEPENPCLVPPTDGYSGLENQFYRVEIHQTGQTGAQAEAWFKFSRENGSVAAAIESFDSPADTITLRTLGRDEILRFHPGDWVEITDDRREFAHRSGQILKVMAVREDTREVDLSGTVEADLIPTGTADDTAADRHSRLIRWDQKGVVRNAADNSEWWNLDAETPGAPPGVIPVPPAGTVLLLEAGITVAFSTAEGAGRYRDLDAWSFWARTAGTQIQELTEAPPHSVQRHYCKLAVLSFPDGTPDDCRHFWPPEVVAGEGCACSVCITPESHNSGALTIQMGIDQVAEAGGGTVCLDPGRYVLAEPVRMHRLFGVTLKGHGVTTLLSWTGEGAAVEIAGCLDVQVENLGIVARPKPPDSGGEAPTAYGLLAQHTAALALRRLAILVEAEGKDRQDHGIALRGLAIGTKIEECLIAAPFGIGSLLLAGSSGATEAIEMEVQYLGLAEVRLIDNILFCGRVALRLGGLAIGIAGTTIARNLFFGLESGVQLDWFEMPTGGTALEGNTILAAGHAALVGVNDIRIEANEISGGAAAGDGLILWPNVAPKQLLAAQVIGNRISDLGGVGVRIAAPCDTLLIKRNQIRRCGLAGILTHPGAEVLHLAIEDNVIADIPGTPDGIGAAGISLAAVLEGQARGNSIRNVGANAPEGALVAGIAMQGIGAVAIEGNSIYLIAPGAQGQGWGVLVRPPFFQLALAGNRIDGVAERSDEPTLWKAIEIGAPGDVEEILNRGDAGKDDFTGATVTLPGFGAAELGYAVVDDVVYELSKVDVRAVAQLGPVQVSVRANQVIHLAPGVEPPLSVVARGLSTVDISHNQCDFAARPKLGVFALAGARRITAGANAIRHQKDDNPSLLLASTAAAPVGNITSGMIRITPGGLQPPFDALNLMLV